MLKKVNEGIGLLVYYVSTAYYNINTLNRILNIIGIRPFLTNLRGKILRIIGEGYFEADVYGTRIKMIDGSEYLKYFSLYARGINYEPVVTRYLKTLLGEFENPTFVDIGAHYGYFTIYAGNLINPNGLVVSIEPNKNFYQGILRNIEINGLQNIIRTYNVALSDHHGKAQMSPSNDRVFIEEQNGETDVVSFDQLCESENIRPDIIKIDVHGAEGKILQGMSEILKNDVSHIFCETHSRKGMRGFRMTDIIQILESAGMDVFEVMDYRQESGKIVQISERVLSTPGGWMLYGRRK